MNYSDKLETPIGPLIISSSDRGISHITFADDNEAIRRYPHSLIDQCKQQLTEYFEGKRTVFSLALDTQGTPFQQVVWNSLSSIPYGEIASYSDIAKAINKPKAVRAVGSANGKNPVSIIVPCHRVIGSKGSLTGYAWGIERKQWLLDLEAEKRPKNTG